MIDRVMGHHRNTSRAAAAALWTALSGASLADDAPASGGLSATVAAVSDYVSRGVSFSDSRGALQVSADYSFAGGIYLGAWTSNYDFGTEAEREVDGYLGFIHNFANGIGLDIGAAHYHFLHEPESNFNEVYLGGLVRPGRRQTVVQRQLLRHRRLRILRRGRRAPGAAACLVAAAARRLHVLRCRGRLGELCQRPADRESQLLRSRRRAARHRHQQ
ncbi:MAG: TorF family putative porin [Desulfobacterales bacterium]|nr:TorF family putative porin [Desulfobacterales bacterium]